MNRSHRYRYNNELLVLAITIILVVGVIVATSVVTVCTSGIFIIGMFVLSALMIRSHHQSLIQSALTVDDIQTPGVHAVVTECAQKLQPGEVEVFLANKDEMNAYTFGIGSPKALVLYTPLLKVLNPDELKFIVGHEMGHVALGHTWLNTIIGGMAGIPAPFGAAVLLYAAFRWWNRMCEFSADRAGLLACGDLNHAVSAMVKLVAPNIRSQQDFEQALTMIDAEDDQVSNRLAEVFQTHPLIIRRINKLRDYVKTREYQQLQADINQNVQSVSRKPVQQPVQTQPQSVAPPESKAEQLPPEERWPWLKPLDEK